jgi:Transcriptional regulators
MRRASEAGRAILSHGTFAQHPRQCGDEGGVVRGYRLDVDPAALGLPLAAFIRVKPNAGQLPRIIDVAAGIPEVVECHRVTGTSIVQSSPVPRRALPLPWPR